LNSLLKINDISHWSLVHAVFYTSAQEKTAGCDIWQSD
jgi:hypothetical protein